MDDLKASNRLVTGKNVAKATQNHLNDGILIAKMI